MIVNVDMATRAYFLLRLLIDETKEHEPVSLQLHAGHPEGFLCAHAAIEYPLQFSREWFSVKVIVSLAPSILLLSTRDVKFRTVILNNFINTSMTDGKKVGGHVNGPSMGMRWDPNPGTLKE